MKHFIRRACACAAAALAAATVPSFTHELSAQQSSGTISWDISPPNQALQGTRLSPAPQVVVANASGQPTAGVRVRLVSGASANIGQMTDSTRILNAEATTDAMGRAEFSNFVIVGSPRTLFLAARAENGLTTPATRVDLQSTIVDQLVALTPPPTELRRGQRPSAPPRVLALAAGRPVADVLIEITKVKGSGTTSGSAARTGPDGIATFSDFTIESNCVVKSCESFVGVLRAQGRPSSDTVSIAIRPGVPASITPVSGEINEVVVGTPLPDLQLRVADDRGLGVPDAMVMLQGQAGAVMKLEKTDPDGLVAFKGVVVNGRPGPVELKASSGNARASVLTAALRVGSATTVRIETQPPARLARDSAWKSSPRVRVLDAAGNPIVGASVTVTPCARRLNSAKKALKSKVDSLKKRQLMQFDCASDGMLASLLASFQGSTRVVTDSTGVATFSDLSLDGRAAEYQLLFTVGDDISSQRFVSSSVIVYDPVRDFDRNYVAISAIKTIAGSVPENEFFDLRFRFRLGGDFHILASSDVALSARGTDSVRGSERKISEASIFTNFRLVNVQSKITDVPERQLFAGAQMKILNTVPYWGFHVGGVELGGSPFQGSTLSVGWLRRQYSDPVVIVNGDSINTARSNLGVEFFLRSSMVDFFRLLTIRGSVLMPLERKGDITSRIAIAVPVGTIYPF